METTTLLLIFKLISLLHIKTPQWLQDYCYDKILVASYLYQHCSKDFTECWWWDDIYRPTKEEQEMMKTNVEQAIICQKFLYLNNE